MNKCGLVLGIIASWCVTQVSASETSRIGQPFWTPEVLQSKASAELESYQLDGLDGRRTKHALAQVYSDRAKFTSRGRQDAEIYRAASPSVVIVLTNDGIGSGIFIGKNQILTNWHVVQDSKNVGVIFKPPKEGDKVSNASLVRADVLKSDSTRDLALLQVAASPPGIRPLEFGSEQDIQIGGDAHAIGHPTGEAWTYTKGLISQFRRHYEWKTKTSAHKATVIQTQTPINPGNSGGPLISENGKLLGVNSFGATNAQGLNFAVSIGEVLTFLESSPVAIASAPNSCKPVERHNGRNKANNGHIVQYDTNCDGRIDFSFSVSDDPKVPKQALIDGNFDGKVDIIVDDLDRDGRWDISYHDVDYDEVIDLIGRHPDGKLKPSRFEKYVASR